MMATLAFSLGVPMLGQGDELARTQQGNNNPWCQDSALSWLPWIASPASGDMLAFTRRVLALRRRYTVFRTSTFLPGQGAAGGAAHWLRASGGAMSEADWHDRARDPCAVLLDTEVQGAVEAGESPDLTTRIVLLMNGGEATVHQHLPPGPWRLMLDTTRPGIEGESMTGAVELQGFAVVLLEEQATYRSRAP